MNSKRIWVRLISFAFFLSAIVFVQAESDSAASTGSLHYAPSREINIANLILDVTPDFKARTITGKETLRFRPIGLPLQELTLDAVDLTIESVSASQKIMTWQATSSNLIINFENPIPPEKEVSINISWNARPAMGLYFRTPEMGYASENTHLWTQGQTTEARHWYPCPDSPNMKFPSDITCRVPQGMVVVSNGKQVSEKKDGDLVAVRWVQDKPSANYLIFLAAGYFKKLEDRYKNIPLTFFVLPADFQYAEETFSDTKGIMAFLEQEIGIPYPWAKYAQVYVKDFSWGGMENTSVTCMSDRNLHPEYEDFMGCRGLMAHELAHQWFGDLVTCKDWAETWLNEGFATYYEWLYDAQNLAPDAVLAYMHQSAKDIAGKNNTTPIVRRDYQHPDEMFDYLTYDKGAWVLHMLRSQLGPALFRKCIQTYLQRYQYKNATTEDFKSVLEEISGRSWDRFFDQWVYRGGEPELQVDYSWDESSKTAKISVQQIQKNTGLFNLPLPIRFTLKNSKVDRTIKVKDKSENFEFVLPEIPQNVLIDPYKTVLATIDFTPPPAMQAK
jgi:aminopeptidase N